MKKTYFFSAAGPVLGDIGLVCGVIIRVYKIVYLSITTRIIAIYSAE